MELHLRFDDYIRRVPTTKGRRPLYYEKRVNKLPKRLMTSEYEYKPFKHSKGKTFYLVDKTTNKRVIRNERYVNKGRHVLVSGQLIYNGSVSMFTRNAMMRGVKKYFADNIPSGFPIFSHPVIISYSVFSPREDANWDLDNHMLPYIKAFQDVIVDLGIIDDDTVHCIKGYDVRFYFSTEHKMLISITDEA